MTSQLALGIKPIIKPSFSNYVASDQNKQVVAHLQYLLQERQGAYIYLWGACGVGKSHLLKSVCDKALTHGLSAEYLAVEMIDVGSSASFLEAVLDSAESKDLICLDNLQLLTGNSVIEELLFSFYNRIKDTNKILIITSNCPVASLNIQLADLQSRLASGVSYHIKLLDDNDKKVLLKIRAYERGMTLTDELAQYIISRGRRDIADLFEMLDRLDHASLSYKRKLSIPFARDILFQGR